MEDCSVAANGMVDITGKKITGDRQVRRGTGVLWAIHGVIGRDKWIEACWDVIAIRVDSSAVQRLIVSSSRVTFRQLCFIAHCDVCLFNLRHSLLGDKCWSFIHSHSHGRGVYDLV